MIKKLPSGHVKLPLEELTSVIIAPAVTLYNPGVLKHINIHLLYCCTIFILMLLFILQWLHYNLQGGHVRVKIKFPVFLVHKKQVLFLYMASTTPYCYHFLPFI